MAFEQVEDPMTQVFALAANRDARQLKLTAAEGYLLSRIDGTTPWRLLREIGGIPAADVDVCLKRWLEEGILEVIAGATRAARGDPSAAAGATDAAQAPAESEWVPEIDETQLDAGLDISLEVQRRILEYEASLGRPYHALLDVAKGAEPKVVKRAYFKLSKEFHPDRYFRKQIGDYGPRLARIFKKILEAHEMLSDPELCQVENQAVAPGAPPTSPPAASAAATDAPATEASAKSAPLQPPVQRPQTKLERLRQRMPFKINHAAIAERRARADEIFRAAELSQRAGRLQEAEASIRIAISFDPSRAEFKEALGSLRIEAAGARASKLLASPSERMSDGELRDALKLLEDVLPYRPHDPELNERAARVCLRLGKLDDALEYVAMLIERTPDVSDYHGLLGRIQRERGDTEAAMRAFEKALEYDESNLEARRAIASMRIGARDQARGGRS